MARKKRDLRSYWSDGLSCACGVDSLSKGRDPYVLPFVPGIVGSLKIF